MHPTSAHHQPSENQAATASLRDRLAPRRSVLSIVVIAWIAVVIAGMWGIWRYEHTAGVVQSSPQQWPSQSLLTASVGQPTLLFFAHPKCPCTRASIGELAKIMVHRREQMRAYAVFVEPPECGAQHDWRNTDLWQSAAQIPGVTPVFDHDGVEARRFQAATSGFVMLYDQTGQLRFRGGITASRGHHGDNLGRSMIVNLLLQGTADVNQTSVYGCELGVTFQPRDQASCQL